MAWIAQAQYAASQKYEGKQAEANPIAPLLELGKLQEGDVPIGIRRVESHGNFHAHTQLRPFFGRDFAIFPPELPFAHLEAISDVTSSTLANAPLGAAFHVSHGGIGLSARVSKLSCRIELPLPIEGLQREHGGDEKQESSTEPLLDARIQFELQHRGGETGSGGATGTRVSVAASICVSSHREKHDNQCNAAVRPDRYWMPSVQ